MSFKLTVTEILKYQLKVSLLISSQKLSRESHRLK